MAESAPWLTDLARGVLDDRPRLDRLWWRVDPVDEGVVIVATVEPVEPGWAVLERRASMSDQELARQYIDQVLEITKRHGMGGQVTPERYESAVQDVARVAQELRRLAVDGP